MKFASMTRVWFELGAPKIMTFLSSQEPVPVRLLLAPQGADEDAAGGHAQAGGGRPDEEGEGEEGGRRRRRQGQVGLLRRQGEDALLSHHLLRVGAHRQVSASGLTRTDVRVELGAPHPTPKKNNMKFVSKQGLV